MHYEVLFLKALAMTILLETLVLAGLSVRFGLKPIPWTRVLFTGFWASFGTLPYLWYVMPAFITHRATLIAIGETSVTLFEIPVIRYFLPASWKQSALYSIACNAASMGAGWVFFR